MASRRTGFDELIYIETDRVSVQIKGSAAHPEFDGVEYTEPAARLRIHGTAPYSLLVNEAAPDDLTQRGESAHTVEYRTQPMFYEQQDYEIVIEGADNEHRISFGHENPNIRRKVTRASKRHELWTGVINFRNEIGLSDLVIRVDGQDYLTLTIEVFPTKIDYEEDYRALLQDVTDEVYNLVFDFMKETYQNYCLGDKRDNSPAEFFAIIRVIYEDLLQSVKRILAEPHHLLETTHEVLPGHKVRRIDGRGERWIEKHPDHAAMDHGEIRVDRALAVRKQVTFDTRENRLTKHILMSTVRRLEELRANYMNLRRSADEERVAEIDGMIRELSRRANSSFLADIDAGGADVGMSLVFSMAPGYRELYKYYLMLQRGLSVTGNMFHISTKDLAQLYEYWCFIKLNSMMKDRYQMISQDILKVQGNGLFVSLEKGAASQVKYRNPGTADVITLSYNPSYRADSGMKSATVAQRPDNVLNLVKRRRVNSAKTVQYDYVFDAKYRINPALEGTSYRSAYGTPGPEEGDINTMHRYRDAIVAQSGTANYERTMFGAYVLFPYADRLDQYKDHRFFRSIESVNIGGLPFLPSNTSFVQEMLDKLIADSPESAFERATLPRGIEERLKKVDWSVRDVLVGSVKDQAVLERVLESREYDVSAKMVGEANLPIHWVALYQPKENFGDQGGVEWVGEVVECAVVGCDQGGADGVSAVAGGASAALGSGRYSGRFYRVKVKEWKKKDCRILPKELASGCYFTNQFLIENSTEYPELLIKSEEQYRLYSELKRIVNDTSVEKVGNAVGSGSIGASGSGFVGAGFTGSVEDGEMDDVGFRHGDTVVRIQDGKICLYGEDKVFGEFMVEEFGRKPNEVVRRMEGRVKEYWERM